MAGGEQLGVMVLTPAFLTSVPGWQGRLATPGRCRHVERAAGFRNGAD
jgi:hypothetical protein